MIPDTMTLIDNTELEKLQKCEKLVKELYQLMIEEVNLIKEMQYVNNKYNNWMGRVGEMIRE